MVDRFQDYLRPRDSKVELRLLTEFGVVCSTEMIGTPVAHFEGERSGFTTTFSSGTRKSV
jgi:hypothetical protein